VRDILVASQPQNPMESSNQSMKWPPSHSDGREDVGQALGVCGFVCGYEDSVLPLIERIIMLNTMQIAVRIVPNSRKSKVVGWEPAAEDCIGFDRMLRIKLNSPPVDGKANRELLQFLSHVWGIRKSEIRLVSGEKGRTKIVRIETDQDLPTDLVAA